MGYRDEAEQLREDLMARDQLLWCIIRQFGGEIIIKREELANYPAEGARLQEIHDGRGDVTLRAKKVVENV